MSTQYTAMMSTEAAMLMSNKSGNFSASIEMMNIDGIGPMNDVGLGCELIKLELDGTSRLTQILSIFGTIICVIGIIGNIFSIIVLCKKSMTKLSTYSYLLGLSICDELSLLLTVFIFLDYLSPFLTTYLSCSAQVSLVNFSKVLLFYIYPIVSSTQALSVWITLAFTVDRYLYVCKPFYGIKFCTRKWASTIIILLYLLATVYSIPQFLERTYVKETIFGIDRIFLSYTELGRSYYFISIYHLFIYSVFVTLIPFFVIILLNGYLVYEIFKSRKRFRKRSHASARFTTASEESKIKDQGKNSITSIRCFGCSKPKNNENLNTDTIEPCLSQKNRPKFSMTSQRSNINFASNQLRNDVNFMLIGLIIVFFICQAPSTILRLITFKNLSLFFKPLYQTTLDISNFLVVCNSTVNCILYVMLGRKFRAEFFKTFCPKMSMKLSQNTNNDFI